MDNSRTVAVVIPLHDHAASIGRAVESVLRQTLGTFELIVVDDGSTDGGGEVVRRFADPRVSLLETPHRGVAAARNAGMQATRAEWVGLLDADDYWEPNFLEKTVAVSNGAPGLVAVFTDIAVDGVQRPRRPAAPHGVVTDYFGARLRYNIAISSSSVLVNRNALLAVGGFREGQVYAEDIDAWFRLSCQGPMWYLAEALSHIDVHSSGSTRSASVRAEGLRTLLGSYEAYRDTARIPRHQARSCRRFMQHQRGRMALHLIHDGQHRVALRTLLTGVPPGRYTWRDYADCLRALAGAWIRPR